MTVANVWSFNHEAPPHIPRAELLGPLVRFRGQAVVVPSTIPHNTLDPRWRTCTDHHLACDCREAEMNEERLEHLSERRHLTDLLEVLLHGHATEMFQADGQERADLECKCQLCDFARRANLVPLPNRQRAYDSRYSHHIF